MKHIIITICLAISIIVTATAAKNSPTTGRVVDGNGSAIEFATVVLLRNGEQTAGTTTDNDGKFSLSAADGDYTLSVQHLGHESVEMQITAGEPLGDITLQESATEIEDVVVKAQLIRREADRFVVDIANVPALAGKDGIELLERSPGIWIDKEEIKVNGKSNPKIYINEREVRMTGTQLISYLRSLHADEIQKIEIVPTTGADYDADTSSGAIHITLKKRRENGLNGSLGTTTQFGYGNQQSNTWLNINGHTGKVNIYGGAWMYTNNNEKSHSHEITTYSGSQSALESRSKLPSKVLNGGGNLGMVYEINSRHSIGAQADYYHNDYKLYTETYTDFTTPDGLTRSDSRFDNKEYSHSVTATANYIYKIDTLGSTFKLLADFTERYTKQNNDNQTTIATPLLTRDSLYRDRTASLYRVTTATAALDKKFSKRWGLKAGLKYTHNNMRDDALYEYEKGGAWLVNEGQCLDLDYSEQIGAAYAILSATLGRFSFVAGLRGEYTYSSGRDVEQNYFSLFPNANISYSLKKDGSYSLVAQYARTIQRPSFWTLRPTRNQLSDYMYQIGNPDLDPAYNNSLSLTFVAKYKYSLTLGMDIRTDQIQQNVVPDPSNPDILVISWENYDSTSSYWASANLPFQLTKWWSLNLNGYYSYAGQKVYANDPTRYQHICNISASTTFTLPRKFFIDLSGMYQSRVEVGNVAVLPTFNLHASLKKNFGEKFSLTLSTRNLIPRQNKIESWGEGFNRRIGMKEGWSRFSAGLQFTYNFKSGKAFNKRAVESSATDEKSRL